jgi:hypothetical protein
MHAMIDRAVPSDVDKLDLRRLDRPLAGERFGTAEEFGKHLRKYIEGDLARRADVEFSADLGAFMALLSVVGQFPSLVAAGRLDARSQLSDVDGWWFGFFSYFASGPPPRRLQELLALQEAGIVSFLGAEMRVETEAGRFVGSSASYPGTVEASTLIEARLPEPSVRRVSDVLLRSMRDAGALAEETVADMVSDAKLPSGRIHTRVADSRLVDGEGRPHRSRFALGPHTSARSAGAFTRPRTNALPFRQNDAVAREILGLI